MKIANKHQNFVFSSLGLHPEFIKELQESKKQDYIKKIIESKNKIVAIGEIGLDYNWVKEQAWQEKQKLMFIEFIKLAKQLDLPIIVHSRDAMQDTIKILEQENMKGKKVLFHIFNTKEFLPRILENNWSISIGPLLLKSKEIKKIVRDCPLEKIMLETDSPWFGFGARGTPLNVIKVAEKIAEIKRLSLNEIEAQTDKNAIGFFQLKLESIS
jgi:TatD DNase family protein